MHLDFSPQEEELRAEVRAFLTANLPENWCGIVHPEGLSASFDITRKLAERGWLNRHWPKEYGGQEGSAWEQVVLQEEYDAFYEPRGGQYMGVNWIGPALMKFGTDYQRRLFLPEIARGDVQWAQLFSEPDAGSDLASLRTTAELDGDSFVVNGEKVWTSYGNAASRGFLLARSERGSTGREGLSVLLIDMDAPGIQVNEIKSPLGWCRINQEVFTDVRVPRDRLLGPLNDGWRVAKAALSFERASIASYSRGTRILARFEDFSTKNALGNEDEITDALVVGRMAELLYYIAVAETEDGGDGATSSSAVRLLNAQYNQQVSHMIEDQVGPVSRVETGDDAALFGGEIEAFCVKRAPVASITAGSREVQTGVIARYGLGLPSPYSSSRQPSQQADR
jgi:alkylation response protein AidB-like acyl-CoA dehydrogenase